DRLNTDVMAQAFAHLFKADPHRLLRWTLKEKPEFLEFFLFHHMSVVVREHDEPPPSDFEDYITLDDKFYFRFPVKSAENDDGDGETILPDAPPEETRPYEDTPELIENMLRSLAEMDLSVFHGLLLETTALLPSEAEEEQYRQRNIRLAEKGFEPPHEAVGIYQPVRSGTLRKRPDTRSNTPAYDPEIPLPPQFFTPFIDGEDLFTAALARVDEAEKAFVFQGELAALINKIISADRVKLRKKETVRDVMKKATAYLSLGLEVIAQKKATPDLAAGLIRTYYLEDIFRAGAGEGVRLKTEARTWYEKSFMAQKSLPLSFLGETYLGVIGGLLIERPMFFANYAEKELYRHFKSLRDISATRRMLDEIIHLDSFLGSLDVDTDTFTVGVLTYKSTILTLWAKNRLGLDEKSPAAPLNLSPIPMDRFRSFFTDLFRGAARIQESGETDLALWAAEAAGIEAANASKLPAPLQSVLYGLVRELEEEYGTVTPSDLDPRFIPHFLLERKA
ncbi:MAG TPA: hypothetical protein DHV36_21485, partial [Desulfobacteraceae bacterium]|nr:hypothetical protein [Desulfobacteraceae bacterium]